MQPTILQKDSRLGSLFFIVLNLFLLGPLSAQTDTIFSIIGVGDMMLGTNYPSKKYLPTNGGADLLMGVRAILTEADVTFGNLEGTLFDGEGKPKTCRDSANCYLFRSPASYIRHFADAGFDMLSLANNHSGDFGLPGRTGTKAVLKNARIAFAGLEGTDETAIIERNGLKFGFCAFAPNAGTCDIRKVEQAKAIVASLQEQCNIVIVSFHGGAEGPDNQHVTSQVEMHLGENRGNVNMFAHAVIDAGADVVFGHGPHVTRAIELYKGRFIAYSLGNFCTYGRFKMIGPTGYAPIIKVFTNDEGEFLRGEITPIFQQKWHGPKIDPQKRVITKIRELTTADFPDSGLSISSKGEITKVSQ